MTMPDPTPTPAVLPDARALLFAELDTAGLLDSHKRRREASSGFSRGLEDAAVRVIERLATPPASDAAVPAGEKMRAQRAGLHLFKKAREDGWQDDGEGAYEYMIRRAYEAGTRRAAPKIASDAGSGLDEEWLLTIEQLLTPPGNVWQGDEPRWQQDAYALVGARLAALATDATDGATGGGEVDLWSDEIERFVEAGFATVSRNPNDHETVVAYRKAIALALATTPGGDLLEQAARYMRHDPLCGIIGGYGYCTCGMETALRALSARDKAEETKDTDDGE